MILTQLLIVLLTLLIFYTIFKSLTKRKIIEGNTTYQPYTKQEKTAYMLAQKNAANIAALKEEVDKVSGLKTIIMDISGNVAQNSENITGIVKAQQTIATKNAPGAAAYAKKNVKPN